jgi:hypothetical protein
MVFPSVSRPLVIHVRHPRPHIPGGRRDRTATEPLGCPPKTVTLDLTCALIFRGRDKGHLLVARRGRFFSYIEDPLTAHRSLGRAIPVLRPHYDAPGALSRGVRCPAHHLKGAPIRTEYPEPPPSSRE